MFTNIRMYNNCFDLVLCMTRIFTTMGCSHLRIMCCRPAICYN